VYLALESTTAFMTIDAINDLFPETAFVESSDMKQFKSGSFRTSEMLLAPLAAALRMVVSDTYRLAMWLKALHWMAGFCCLLAIHRISRYWVANESVLFFVTFFYIGLLLPTNALALKVFNYDKLSLFFTALGVMSMARAIKEPHDHAATLGLVSLALAAQEKLIAAPILWLALPVYAYLRVRRLRSRAVWRDALISSLMGVAWVLGIHLAAFAVVSLAGGSNLFLTTVFKPLLSVVWPLTQTAFGVPRVDHPLLVVLACIGFTFAGALMLYAITGLHGKAAPSPAWIPNVRPVVISVVVAAVFVIGVAWTFSGEIFLGPAMPVPDHLFKPTHTFNDLYWHYGAATRAAHLFRSTAAYLAVFVHALPSVAWGVIFFGCFIGLTPSAAAKDPVVSSYLFYLVSGLSLLSPVFFALAQMPPGIRYFNVFLFLAVFIALLRICSRQYRSRLKPLVVAVSIGLLVAEVLAYRPVFGAFAPFWAHEPDTRFTATVQPGQLVSMFRWTGWGEEVMLAGRRIENRCRNAGCGDIRLFWAYPGAWLQPTAIARENIAGITGHSRLNYDDREYVVVNRSAVVQQMVSFPRQADPVDTIRFGGYTQAWIFRGDDLRKAGFRF